MFITTTSAYHVSPHIISQWLQPKMLFMYEEVSLTDLVPAHGYYNHHVLPTMKSLLLPVSMLKDDEQLGFSLDEKITMFDRHCVHRCVHRCVHEESMYSNGCSSSNTSTPNSINSMEYNKSTGSFEQNVLFNGNSHVDSIVQYGCHMSMDTSIPNTNQSIVTTQTETNSLSQLSNFELLNYICSSVNYRPRGRPRKRFGVEFTEHVFSQLCNGKVHNNEGFRVKNRIIEKKKTRKICK